MSDREGLRALALAAAIFLNHVSLKAALELPNFSFEEELQRSFIQRTEAISDEEWNTILAQGGEAETYSIQKGDSLWEVSKTIFGSGFFWPKLWQLNSEITNPHDIQPGTTLYFIDRGLDAPVALQTLAATEETTVTPAAELSATENEILEIEWVEPSLPAPNKKSRKVMSIIPPSFFNWQGDVDDNQDVVSVESAEARIFSLQDYYPEYILLDSELPSVGKIVSTHSATLKGVGLYDEVFVQLTQGGVDDEFTVFQAGEEIRFRRQDEKKKARSVEIQGRLKIIRSVDPSKGIFKAIVTKALQRVELGGVLVNRDLLRVKWGAQGEPGVGEGDIIGGRYDDRREMYSTGSLVYLNLGQNDGVQAGQVFFVQKNYKARGLEFETSEKPRIGKLKIVDSDREVATAVVIEAQEEIMTGDRISAQ